MFEIIEHTADVGLRIRADDLNGLFAEAGRALFSLIVENLEAVRSEQAREIELRAGNLEDLFFDWLDELLYTFDSGHVVLCRFEAHVEGNVLRGRASGEKLDESRHKLEREVKAITYHGLSVRQIDAQWQAEVIVDI